MTDARIATLDQGQVNQRILAKESKVDFRRVEAASVKRTTNLTSAEGKRMFLRCFGTFQLNVHFISTLARMRLPHEQVEAVEEIIRKRLNEAKARFDKAIDGAQALFEQNGIMDVATYDTVPLTIEVGVLSSLGRRYFEVIHKMDQVMPILQTLEVEEILTLRQADAQRADCKKAIIRVARSARELATGLRRGMNERDAAPAAEAASAPVAGHPAGESANEVLPAQDEGELADDRSPVADGVAG